MPSSVDRVHLARTLVETLTRIQGDEASIDPIAHEIADATEAQTPYWTAISETARAIVHDRDEADVRTAELLVMANELVRLVEMSEATPTEAAA